MKRVLLAVLVVLLVMAMFWGPCGDVHNLSPLQAAPPSSLNWANTTCNEAVTYTSFASAQKKVSKVGDYVASRAGKFVICNAVSAVLPSCPEPKECPACNCPACPAQKDCPACPDVKCPDAVPCPTLQPQPIEFIVQGNVSSTKI